MSSRVTIRFVKLHSWHRAAAFNVYHDEGYWLGANYEQVNGAPVRLWRYSWEQAGFGHGRFGYGSFGWAQGGVTSGGLGFGRFGYGEFGYYNEEAWWVTPKAYPDGLHCFGISLVGSNNAISYWPIEQTILIRSTPAAPRILELVSMTGGQAQVRWTGSVDL